MSLRLEDWERLIQEKKEGKDGSPASQSNGAFARTG